MLKEKKSKVNEVFNIQTNDNEIGLWRVCQEVCPWQESTQ